MPDASGISPATAHQLAPGLESHHSNLKKGKAISNVGTCINVSRVRSILFFLLPRLRWSEDVDAARAVRSVKAANAAAAETKPCAMAGFLEANPVQKKDPGLGRGQLITETAFSSFIELSGPQPALAP